MARPIRHTQQSLWLPVLIAGSIMTVIMITVLIAAIHLSDRVTGRPIPAPQPAPRMTPTAPAPAPVPAPAPAPAATSPAPADELTRDNIARTDFGRIELISTQIARAQIQHLDKQVESVEEYLIVRVQIYNETTDVMMRYQTWQGGNVPVPEIASITDDRHNGYRRVTFGGNVQVIDHVEDVSIRPGESIADVLIFERPVDQFQWVRITLPLANVGHAGKTVFHIDAADISRD